MAVTANDGTLQVHKFLKDADALLGTISNLEIDKVNLNAGSEALPQLGTVGEMARRLQDKLAILTQ